MNKNTTAASGVEEGEIGRARGSEPYLLEGRFNEIERPWFSCDCFIAQRSYLFLGSRSGLSIHACLGPFRPFYLYDPVLMTDGGSGTLMPCGPDDGWGVLASPYRP